MKPPALPPSRDIAAADAVLQARTRADASTPPRGDAVWRQLVGAASARYRDAGRFAVHFARGKLSRDPLFRALLEHGDLSGATHVLDLGCGQALLASLLAACETQCAAGVWPDDWPAPPLRVRYSGIELMPRDVERARAALAELPRAQVSAGDLRDAALPPCDVAVIFDVLHYLEPDAQRRVLERVAAALARRGRLLLRVGDAGEGWRFVASQWVDRVVTTLRGHRAPPTWCRTLAQWRELLREVGFAGVQARAMSRGTPFANVLLVCERAPHEPARGAPRA